MADNKKKTQVFPKVIGKRYVVLVNDQPSGSPFATRKEAFTYISGLVLNESITSVKVVNETITHKTIKAFVPKTNVVTLVASDLGPTLE